MKNKILGVLAAWATGVMLAYGDCPKTVNDMVFKQHGMQNIGVCSGGYIAEYEVKLYEEYPEIIYQISFDDGSGGYVYTLDELKAMDGVVTHVFDMPSCGNTARGFFSATVNLVCGGYDLGGASIHNVKVLAPPSAYFEVPDTVCVNEDVDFYNRSLAGTNFTCEEVLESEWDFGDGKGTSEDYSPTYSYDEPGEYEVRLVVYSDKDTPCTYDTMRRSVVVLDRPRLNAIPDIEVCAGRTVNPIAVGGTQVSYVAWSGGEDVGLADGAADDKHKVIEGFVAKNETKVNLTREVTVWAYNSKDCDRPGEDGRITFNVTVKPAPSIDQPGDVAVCAEDETDDIVFTSPIASTTFFYTAEGGEAIGMAETGEGKIESFAAVNDTFEPITVEVVVTSSNSDPAMSECGGDEKRFNITVLPKPRPSVTLKDPTTCGGTDGRVIIGNLAPGKRYDVTDMDGVLMVGANADGEGTITVRHLGEGVQTWQVGLGVCRTALDPIELIEPVTPVKPSLKLPEHTACVGDDIVLNAETEADVEYLWTGPNGWVSTEAAPVLEDVSQKDSGTYGLEVTRANCVSEKAYIELDVKKDPEVNLAALPEICAGESVAMERYVKYDWNNMPEDARKVKWTIVAPREGNEAEYVSGDENAKTPTLTFGHDGVWIVRVDVESVGCGGNALNDERQLTVDEPIDLVLDPLGEVCANTAAEQNENGVSLHADPEGGTWTCAAQPDWVNGDVFWPNAPGRYVIAYDVKRKSCVAHGEVDVRVKDYPMVEPGEDESICVNDNRRIALGGNPAGGVWEGEYVNLKDGVYGFDNQDVEVGQYVVRYTYTDADGCKASAEKTVRVNGLPGTAFETERCYPDAVRFRAMETDAVNVKWDYGDGIGDETGEHLYAEIGAYDVKIVVRNTAGCRDSAVKKIWVEQYPDPIFGMNTAEGCSPVEIYFNPKAKWIDPNTKFEWDFGNGETYEGFEPPRRTYTATGYDSIYTVRMTMSNVCGSKAWEEKIAIYSAPGADFDMDKTWECSPVKVTFQNKTLGSMNGRTYLWDFGDGETSEERFPVHEFSAGMEESKEYIITLTVSNKCGSDQAEKTLLVKPQSIKAQFSNPTPQGCVGAEICFENNSIGLTEDELYGRAAWDFGNGDVSAAWRGCTTYATPGVYTVKLTAYNACGQDTATSTVEIKEAPKITLYAENQVCRGEEFSPDITTDIGVREVVWDWGDGTSSNTRYPKHRYNAAGTYTIGVTVKGDNLAECEATGSADVVVRELPNPVIEPLSAAGCSPVEFKPVVEEGYYAVTDYEGDGTWSAAESHVYVNRSDTIRRVEVRFKIEDTWGCKAEQAGFVRVYPQPHADFVSESESGLPEKVFLYNRSSGHDDCLWMLPEGEIGGCGDVQFELSDNEEREIGLHVENRYGCVDEKYETYRAHIRGLYFPNTFVPNSDNEAVNRFNGVGVDLKRYKLEIFDLYGNLLYETTSLDENGRPDEGWDGTDKQGKRLPQDVYSWRAQGEFNDGTRWPQGNENGQRTMGRGSVLLLVK